MIELQNAIESLSLESFTEAASAYRRFPSVMGLNTYSFEKDRVKVILGPLKIGDTSKSVLAENSLFLKKT